MGKTVLQRKDRLNLSVWHWIWQNHIRTEKDYLWFSNLTAPHPCQPKASYWQTVLSETQMMYFQKNSPWGSCSEALQDMQKWERKFAAHKVVTKSCCRKQRQCSLFQETHKPGAGWKGCLSKGLGSPAPHSTTSHQGSPSCLPALLKSSKLVEGFSLHSIIYVKQQWLQKQITYYPNKLGYHKLPIHWLGYHILRVCHKLPSPGMWAPLAGRQGVNPDGQGLREVGCGLGWARATGGASGPPAPPQGVAHLRGHLWEPSRGAPGCISLASSAASGAALLAPLSTKPPEGRPLASLREPQPDGRSPIHGGPSGPWGPSSSAPSTAPCQPPRKHRTSLSIDSPTGVMLSEIFLKRLTKAEAFWGCPWMPLKPENLARSWLLLREGQAWPPLPWPKQCPEAWGARWPETPRAPAATHLPTGPESHSSCWTRGPQLPGASCSREFSWVPAASRANTEKHLLQYVLCVF